MARCETPVARIEIGYDLHEGLADARDMNERRDVFPATHTGLALALDTRDYEDLCLAGSYGIANAYVVLVMGDGGEVQVLEDDLGEDGPGVSEACANALLTTDGELDPDDVFALRGPVWDGNNHVSFTPTRSLAMLADEDSWERRGHALIQWGTDGEFSTVDDIRLDDGWAIADEYWETYGNEPWSHGDLDADDREELLCGAGIEADRVDVDDDVMILVPEADVDRAREIFEIVTEAEEESDVSRSYDRDDD